MVIIGDIKNLIIIEVALTGCHGGGCQEWLSWGGVMGGVMRWCHELVSLGSCHGFRG